jgi:hypothetical protein
LSNSVAARIRTLSLLTLGGHRPRLRHYRGCRAGRSRCAGLTTVRRQHRTIPSPCQRSALVHIHRERHTGSVSARVMFGCLNIRSLEPKLDCLLGVSRGRAIHLMLLTESWHDPDSTGVRRQRANGFTVVEHTRPPTQSMTLAINHGGGLAAAALSIHPAAVDIGLHPAAS